MDKTYDSVSLAAMPSAAVTWLHLFRHGRVADDGRRLCRGHKDDPLSDAGWAQSHALVELARGLPNPAGVLASDLQRARALGEMVAAALDIELRVFSELREQYMGAWEGQAWEDLTREDAAGVKAYWDDYHCAPAGGGESVADLGARLQNWWQTNSGWLSGRRWVVVTHIGVIRWFCCQALQLGLGESLRFTPGPGTHTAIALAEAGGVIEILGERPQPAADHLP